MHAVRIIVTGLVQGVFYRAETQKKARELGLMGWVKNCDDGSVEIVAEGSDDALQELEKWCWKGPQAARVENVRIAPELDPHLKSFDILG